MSNKKVEIPSGTIEVLSSGIFIFTAKDGLYMEPKYAIPMIDTVGELSGGQKVPMLMDIRKIKGASKQSRTDFKNNTERSPSRLVKAGAILVNSGISKILGNILLGIRKPPFTAKLFTKKEEALKWLEQFL